MGACRLAARRRARVTARSAVNYDEKGGCSLKHQRCLGCDQTIWQRFGNSTGDVSPTWLQCYWQKSGDVTACRTGNLTVSPTCFQRHADGRRAGLKIRWPPLGGAPERCHRVVPDGLEQGLTFWPSYFGSPTIRRPPIGSKSHGLHMH
jgi:hypothetical protein